MRLYPTGKKMDGDALCHVARELPDIVVRFWAHVDWKLWWEFSMSEIQAAFQTHNSFWSSYTCRTLGGRDHTAMWTISQ
jgi:hypothetical protein